MPSETDLCNDALAQIGENEITAIDDETVNANRCLRFLPGVRDEILRKHLWNFAMKRVTPALSATAPVSRFSYAYAIPADCLRVVRLGTDDDVMWKIEGRFLVTDAESITIVYIARIEDPNVWDSIAYQAISTRLASKLAGSIKRDVKLAAGLYELSKEIMSDALTVDGQEGIQDTIDTPDLTDDVRND